MRWQAAAKLKEMEDSMLKYYMANADKAGIGLECLPGVKQLLQELKVRERFTAFACTTNNIAQSDVVGIYWFNLGYVVFNSLCWHMLPSSKDSDMVCSPNTYA